MVVSLRDNISDDISCFRPRFLGAFTCGTVVSLESNGYEFFAMDI